MKKVLGKVKAILTDKTGAGLFEALISIFVFTVLMSAVAMMIALSLRITGIANTQAKERQEEANAVVIGDDTDPRVHTQTGYKVEFIIKNGLTTAVDVTVYSSEDWGFASFDPD